MDTHTTAWPVNIGQAAQLSGISPKMLRHYEGLGLLGEVRRTDSNYRQYAESDVHTLRFIRRARDMGFTLDEIRDLVNLWHNRRRSSDTVKRIAQKHIGDLAERIAALEAMRRTLEDLVVRCPGNDRPDCPILDDLGGGADKDLYKNHTEPATLLHRSRPQ
ncbi:MAG: Cu(I)-responsive transcriptional regulator [Comamonadaceae bacterium]|jgi:Cu(I)-responsive transcriptional regulator|uniref:Cu(I)-responsive transcriptional regulator n=1 Tax=Hydrogenophaga borbori TaxID=2294117 RepID=A0A372EJA0_9BURK|nr:MULTISPECIES: Cu(I)-responsive transcriptional regulator [Hydrogenophaga]NCT98217.1 Cu(I)-responsive transcriptional regulator [Comamonadaceae bacterium]RFP78744.1 Cu(I)-responsive transcriptional regulator [Hydrogenophaga borbori]WQB83828.1 Cu(I)-responsive transcriptional regulator [Hydrogenophaga sp. SNF1]